MKAVIQRVDEASVDVDGRRVAQTGKGMMILLGVIEGDDQSDVDLLVRKCSQLRIFDDEQGRMNLSAIDTKAETLVVSQFTLAASTKKGNRPSYIAAAGHETAIPLYESFCRKMSLATGVETQHGQFGAEMKVRITGDGPVTIIIDTKNQN